MTLSPIKSSITIKEPPLVIAPRPIVLNTDCFEDNTIVVRIIRVNYTVPPRICVKEYLSIRIIYPIGTVKGFDLSSDTLNIQPFNFCFLPKANPLRFYSVRKNFLLMAYAKLKM
ncbi:hypothetical protein RhiirA5_431591 [Rhizophagus irregularis]|uniref:Uncharacterized protein n=1 Tax=Rhizophagus irregularis TaxID=588596 RepID=A0A2N0NUS4_9GLOM|nr:hypothetical protein RhiirA5_431591 [Rhizophagus irregularis]CAB5147611.1 unnamed protein product [Rhizophagus irregularis]